MAKVLPDEKGASGPVADKAGLALKGAVQVLVRGRYDKDTVEFRMGFE